MKNMNQYVKNDYPAELLNRSAWMEMLDSQIYYVEAQSGESTDLPIDLDRRTDIVRGEDIQKNDGSTMRTADDAVVDMATLHDEIKLPSSLLSLPNDGLPATIKSFLAKPYNYMQGNFTNTDIATTFGQFATSLPLRTNAMFVDKLSGVMSLRYTTVVTLQVNATRFQQGRYILAFIPTGGAEFNPATTSQMTNWNDMHRANKCQVTQLHHVELDLNTDTSVQLRIPYQGAFPALCWNPTSNLEYFGDPGQVFIYPYSPLAAAAGELEAGFTLWVHYEDVEVFGNTIPNATTRPTNARVEAQSGFTPRNRVGRNIRKNVDIFQQEQDSKKPLSGGLRLVSEGTEELSKVPLLSSVAGPISWVTKMASNAASSLGWSKPNINDKLCRMNRFPHPYIANEDQPDDSQPLSLFSDNHIGVTPGFSAVDTDELSINYLKSIFGYWNEVQWPLSATQGTLLMSGLLDPWDMRCVPYSTATAEYQHTPVSFAASFFQRYSGGFVIKIKVIKTEFHSGRLLFAFNPYESACFDGTIAYADTPYLHKTILDVREQNEFTIEVPYVSITPWRDVGTLSTDNTAPYGSWALFVLDELVAPETVSNYATILFEVAGAPDLKFSVPRATLRCPMIPATLQMGSLFNAESDANPTLNDVSTVGGTIRGEISYDKEEHCVGEAITSLRSLLKRGGYMGYTLNTSATTQNVRVLPWAWTYTVTSPPAEKEVTYDPYAILSSVYALQRGGVRIRHMVTNTNGNIIASLRPTGADQADQPEIFDISNTNSQTFLDNSASSQICWGLQTLGGLSVQVPYYHYTHSSPCAAQAVGIGASYSFSQASGANSNVLELQYQTNVNLRTSPYYRSGADDCNFGCFVSVPLMARVTAGTAPT